MPPPGLTWKKIEVTIPTAGTAVPLSATPIYTTDFELHAPATNVGPVYFGGTAVNNTWIPRAPGSTVNFSSGSGALRGVNSELGFDLSKLFVDADNNGNKVIVQYLTDE